MIRLMYTVGCTRVPRSPERGAQWQYAGVVVGAGNSALCAALAARERGADVVVMERASRQLRGGDPSFTAGSMRVAYNATCAPIFDESRRMLDD